MRDCNLFVLLIHICVISFLNSFKHVTGKNVIVEMGADLIHRYIAPLINSNKDVIATTSLPPFRTQRDTASTRSTPEPIPTTRTFDLLRFWSGESLKSRKHGHYRNLTPKESMKSRKHNHQNITRVFRSHSYELKDERRRSHEQRKNSILQEKKDHIKRLRAVVSRSNNESDESFDAARDPKINGYTLLQDMKRILANNDENITISSIAKTLDFHDIVLIKMGKGPKYFRALDGENKYEDEAPQKKIILIVHGLSAQGFRSIPCLYREKSFLRLVDIYVSFLDKFDIFLIPMGNPEGIADDTLGTWNKNKSPQSACSGVALDRNFDVEWTTDMNSCSHQYAGPKAFSEPESRAVADLIHHYSHKIIAYIHVHAASIGPDVFKGDAVLYPRGYIDQEDDDKYVDMDADIEESLKTAGFKFFNVAMTSIYSWYGKVTGSSVDYATKVYGIPYAMEFLMQSYVDQENDKMAKTISEKVADNALTEVWKRIIKVIFNHIYKTTSPSGSVSEEIVQDVT